MATQPIQQLWLEVDTELPAGWRSGPAAAVLENLSFDDALLSVEADGSFVLTVTIPSDTPLDLAIPGLPGFGLTIGEFEDAGFDLELQYSANALKIGAVNVPVTLYLPDTLLRPVDDDAAVALVGRGNFQLSSLGEVKIQLEGGVDLPPCYLGDASGIIISATGLQLDLSLFHSPPEVLAAGFDESFVGLYFQEVRVTLPAGFPALLPQDLVLKKCIIGSGGVSGELDVAYHPVYDAAAKTFSGPGAGEIFGLPFGLEQVDLVLRRNSLTRASFTGKLLLPFFDEIGRAHV